jgi:hypothetical protein
VGEVPVEQGRLEFRIRAVFQAAEVEELFRLGEEDFGVAAEDGVQPRRARALGADDQEVGKSVEREAFALDFAVAQAFQDATGNQGGSPPAGPPP